MPIFGGVQLQSESTFPFLYIIISQLWESFEPPSSTPGETGIFARELFCTKFNFEQLLFKPFFDAMRIFGSVEPQTRRIFHLSTL